MFRFAYVLLLAQNLGAMGVKPKPADPMTMAAEQYARADFDEAGAVYRSLAPLEPKARRQWIALLFERQGYGALSLALSGTAKKDELMLLARSRANLADWAGALVALRGLKIREAALLRAEALDALGDAGAEKAYDEALAYDKRNPMASLAQFKAADFAARRGLWELAEKRFKRAERLDQSQSGIQMRLAGLYVDRGRYADAKTRYERLLKSDPNDLEARDCLNQLLKAEPTLVAEAKAREAKRDSERLSGSNLRVVPIPGRFAESMISVGVLQQAARFKFRCGADCLITPMGLSLPAGALYEVALRDKRWSLNRLDAQGASLVAKFDGGRMRLSQSDPTATLALFDVDFGSGYFWAGREDRFFRGSLELNFDGVKSVTLLNTLPLDAYLCGVLPSEMPASWPREALLAQAVAARGDALSKRGRHKAQGFDLCSDVHCAMYRGAGEESAASTAAVTATAGELLEQNGKALGGIYMNSCGGHTQDAWEAWSGEAKTRRHAVADGVADGVFPLGPAELVDYLDDADDQSHGWCGRDSGEPYSEYRWALRLSPEDLERSVARRHAVGHIMAVEPLERSVAGYVQRVRFTGTTGSSIGSSDYIRTAIKGLRSNLFYVETRRDVLGQPIEFIFHGGGWGHGVGMCQRGAAAMAAAGQTHGDILRHYFKGGEITRRY